jgi:signal transduction histidine kinase
MSYSVLIVDDDYFSVQLLKAILIQNGYSVLGFATNGEDGITEAKRQKPDIVFMDIYMPGNIDGIDAGTTIQKEFGIPVIYITSDNEHNTFTKVLSTNPTGYIIKPFNRESLLMVIEMAILKNKMTKHLEGEVQERTEELKRKNILLEHALTKEREINEFRSKIVTSISHEFKTPLTTIFSSTELIERYIKNDKSNQKASKHLSLIKESVELLTSHIGDVLKYREFESLNELNLEETNPEEYFNNLVNFYKKGVGKNHKLTLTQKKLPHILLLDKRLIRETLGNFISNAIKYSKQKSAVKIDIKVISGYLNLSVTDEGIGISKEDQKNLFEYFYRANGNSNIEGSGVGLAIVKQAVSLMNGTFSVQSTPGNGSTFSFAIPLNNIPQQSPNSNDKKH